MRSKTLLTALWSLCFSFDATGHSMHRRDVPPQDALYASSGLTINSVPYSTRVHWMRRANEALSELASPCPFAAFGSVIVNHTDTSGLGEEICIGANANSAEGNPTLHGEIAAINNCSEVLQGPRFNLSAAEALSAMKSLSLYTNAESCPMCASAIRWAGFREYIYGTSIDYLIEKGWGQIRISSLEIFQESFDLPSQARLISDVLRNETDVYFGWQYDPAAPCPSGCSRERVSGSCIRD
ncbi:uncharacterized protein PV09_02710 [Verruconis gallopava]|uniref:CMP/dCMP-type deaminase domain-containing protein n=1 Tax=Verruconis gallopava TaxID=253628 RepID=A0A0D1XTY0_9PEZI|nr:uncharacterized protein PV09_02710 [Verruconis gallopava]KIW06236.1 hypothetical protein PV09_02710 [Verruconis gallopava]